MKYVSYEVCLMKKGLSQTCHRFFSTVSNPTRLATLEKLREGPMNVSQLAEALNQEQSMISHNLRPLVRCRFVHVERRGRERIYRLNRETVEALFKIVENHAEKYCPTGGRCP
ncbi:transcriptional regulator [Candidatus Bathyarchaeota archaeon]|nr:MAG: transcriptional regulator [Candidatus Bathyarchaeota archaeon]